MQQFGACVDCVFYLYNRDRDSECLSNADLVFKEIFGWVYERQLPRVKNKDGDCREFTRRVVSDNFVVPRKLADRRKGHAT